MVGLEFIPHVGRRIHSLFHSSEGRMDTSLFPMRRWVRAVVAYALIWVAVSSFSAISRADGPSGPRGGIVDCNNNGVDDALDIDPADPDGDGFVSADCNANLVPDECDIATCVSGDVSCADCDGNGAVDSCEVGTWAVEPRLTAPMPRVGGDYFGTAVSLRFGRLAVGAARAAPNFSTVIYLYSRVGNAWQLESEIPVSSFGVVGAGRFRITQSADRLVVGEGDYGLDGQVVVFRLETGEWEEEQRLTVQGADGFGYDSAIFGDRVVVGAPQALSGVGAVYVFHRTGTSWNLEAKLSEPAVTGFESFGRCVAISDNMIAVGEPGHAPEAPDLYGAVHIYERVNEQWVASQTILPPALGPGRHSVGDAIAMRDGYLVVGDSGDYLLPSNIDGYALVYRREAGAWVFDGLLEGSQSWTGSFGRAVDIGENTIVVGAPNIDNNYPYYGQYGKAYVFEKQDGAWVESAFLPPPQSPEHRHLGRDVTCSGNLVVAGARGTITTMPDPTEGDWVEGGVYTMLLSNDCDNDGVLDACEVSSGAADVNGNLRPDDCEPDCNANAIPDEFELAGNDCNNNFVPDDCDADPSDPDGDGLVSSDCDGNGVLDECEIGNWSLRQTLNLSEFQSLWRFKSSGEWLIVVGSDEPPRLYRMIGGQWAFQQLLTPSTPIDGEGYGASIAIDGNKAMVGASTAGKVYTFEFDGAQWQERDVLRPPAGETWTSFGASTDISGNTAIVGAAVYRWDGAHWGFEARLMPPPELTDVGFGDPVAVDGNVIAIAAPQYLVSSTQRGAVHLFERVAGVWEYAGLLTASDGTQSDRFGFSVALSGRRLAVGAYYANSPTTMGSGGVYLFSKVDGLWGERLKLTPENGVNSTFFGAALDLEQDVLLVGAWRWRTDPTTSYPYGAALLYRLDGDAEAELLGFFKEDAPIGTEYGRLVGLSRRGLFISKPAFSVATKGVQYLEGAFDCNQNLVPDWCETDCNANGQADTCESMGRDLFLFVEKLLSGSADDDSCLFDLTGDGAIDGLDIQPFIDRYLASAP